MDYDEYMKYFFQGGCKDCLEKNMTGDWCDDCHIIEAASGHSMTEKECHSKFVNDESFRKKIVEKYAGYDFG